MNRILGVGLFIFALILGAVVPAQVSAQLGPCPDSGTCPTGQTCFDPPVGGAQCWKLCTPDSGDPAEGCPSGSICGDNGAGTNICISLEGATIDYSGITSETPTTSETLTGNATSAQPFVSITPQLNVDIPGVELTPAVKSGDYVYVPFLGQYISGAYRFAVGIVLIISIIMVVWGGFRYLIGSGFEDVNRGKEIIRDAIAGMLIVIGAYLILQTINPATLNLSVLKLGFVEPQIELLDASTYRATTGRDIPSIGEVKAVIREVAAEHSLDLCAFDAVAGGESGYRANAIGHDENVPRSTVFSRRAFIFYGRKYNGENFSVPDGPPASGSACRAHLPRSGSWSEAQLSAFQNRGIRNNDRFDPNSPPDFGLDTRFSHGIGAGQVTLLPDSSCRLSRCSDGNLGRRVGDRCYSVPELLEPRAQMEAAAGIYQRAERNCSSQRDPYKKQRCIFARYGGTGCSVRVGACRKMKKVMDCRGQSASRERADCRSWLREQSSYCNDFSND